MNAPSFYNEGMIESYYTFEKDSLGEGSPCCGYKMPPHPEPTPKPRMPDIPCQSCCGCSSCQRGAIRFKNPECPMNAVIPAITVEDISGIRNIADCFVHVENINTTFYIDDKHRMMITWAGPVEADDYNYAENPLGLRSQMLYDFANDKAVYYNKLGEYRTFDLTSPEV